MVVGLALTFTEVRLEHIEKEELSKVVTPLGIVREVMPEQPKKARMPMLVKLCGRDTDVRPLHP